MREEFEIDEIVEGCKGEVDDERTDVEEEPGHQDASGQTHGVGGAEDWGCDVVIDGVDKVVRIEIGEACHNADGLHSVDAIQRNELLREGETCPGRDSRSLGR